MTRKTNQAWNHEILQWQKSGMSRKQYCAMHKLSYWTFREKEKKLNESPSEKLIKISTKVSQKVTDSASTLELLINRKISIRLTKGYDAELLRNVLLELGVSL
jgi:hypothetical protein